MDQELHHWPIDKFIDYANNPRINDPAVEKVSAAIHKFGFRVPIVALSSGEVVDGHLRLKAARKLNLETIPVLLADDMSESDIKGFRLSVNRMAELADWDEDLLKIELDSLLELDFDIGSLGFDVDYINELLDEPNEGLTDEDAVPEPPEDPITKRGDVWLLGEHRVMCGDSTMIDDVEKLMDGNKADMVFTDPPYGVSYQSNMRTKSGKFDTLKNDDEFLDVTPIIEAFSDGWVFIWTSWKVLTKWIDMFAGFGYPSNQIIWFKGGGGIGDLKKTFSSDYETALVWNRGYPLTGKRIGSVWSIGKDKAVEYKHPTQKPVALPEEAIDKTTKPKSSVLDLFGGSGSTLIACEKTNRNCYMMELDEKYCDVIVKRWQEFTGKKAILELNGETFND